MDGSVHGPDSGGESIQPKRLRNKRIKKVIERSKAVSKALVEGIKQNGGIFAAFSQAGGNMNVALKCAEEYDTMLREYVLIDS